MAEEGDNAGGDPVSDIFRQMGVGNDSAPGSN